MQRIFLSEKPIVQRTDEAVLRDLGDGIGCIQFLSKGNSITQSVREFLLKVTAENLMGFDGLVIGSQDKHFSVGANLVSIRERIERKAFEALGRQVASFQTMTRTVRACRKPIVAAPYGMTLGGGLELTLHAHARVALNKCHMGLVEPGVGLIPGGGGTKEIAFRIAEKPACDQEQARRNILRALLTRTISKNAQDAVSLGYLSETDDIVQEREDLIAAAKQRCLSMVRKGLHRQVTMQIRLPGRSSFQSLCNYLTELLEQGVIAPYDVEIGKTLARVLTGGEQADETWYTEEQVLTMEREGFVELAQHKQTLERIISFLECNELLRN